MRFAIINPSGNVLEWFSSARSAVSVLDDMRRASDADVDLMAFRDDGQPLDTLIWAQPSVSPDAILPTPNPVTVSIGSATVMLTGSVTQSLPPPPANETDQRRPRDLVPMLG